MREQPERDPAAMARRVRDYLAGVGEPPPLVGATALPLPLYSRGKVREMYDLGDRLLMVTSDRVSAYDVVMDQLIPGKGAVLTALSAFWFRHTAGIVENHLLTDDVAAALPELARAHPEIVGRSLVVRKARRIDVECVVRGYLAGSGWAEYRRDGTLAGEPLPPGLREAERLPEARFTPATKAETGHDENITIAELERRVGSELSALLVATSLALYQHAEAHARARGLILADTKFEFGLLDGRLVLIDELLTPDSSRYWPADGYAPGRAQPSFDKQYLRDYLDSTGWNHEPPPPPLPPEVVAQTAAKYREAYQRLTS
ncbi:MAG TPA: phosphoribosylaminoimidazolesuccinocarboxamide synthase [Chloroflexota bacterium]|jgi:phosphoribosylaminoimidazole-succinocarboxamide synthase|nr:phosphoribosylaminoimidazolesuccinocarboxamide synthase [Chloroflexota bacterium]